MHSICYTLEHRVLIFIHHKYLLKCSSYKTYRTNNRYFVVATNLDIIILNVVFLFYLYDLDLSSEWVFDTLIPF